MLVKTFQAGEMSEALKMVKAELGRDAMILSSKKERRKGILGLFSKPYFEVTAALDPRPVPRPDAYREQPAPAPERELSTREEFQNSMLGPLAREVRELKQRLEALSRKDALEVAAPAAESDAQPAPQDTGAELHPALKNIGKDELEELKKLLYNAVAERREKQARPITFPAADAAAGQPVAWKPVLDQIEVVAPQAQEQAVPEESRVPEVAPEVRRMLEQLVCELQSEDVGPAAIDQLINEITPAAAGGVDLDELRALLAVTLAGMIKCSGSLRIKKNGPRIVAMVGPAGVGKTTTIAKLAALYGLERGASVALITTDSFRVGAVEQLKSYAKIMDLPLEVAGNSQELAGALAKHADKNLVLIDTAGRSPKDLERLEELKGYLECQPGIDVYLCLSATTRSREIDETVATFGALPISKIVFTKLDESRSFGCIVDTCLKHKMPLSYLSTGQRVPEDIEVATAKKLVSLVVKESAMSGNMEPVSLP
jgi:flagellar biosynthesis protein FlhF